MRILKPGEPCPCCGQPIRDDVPRLNLLLLSYIAEGLSLMDAINAMAEVMELPPPDGVMAEMSKGIRQSATPEGPTTDFCSPPERQSDAGEKQAIVQRLKDCRADVNCGPHKIKFGPLVSYKGKKISVFKLAEIFESKARMMEIGELQKIARGLDRLDKKGASDGDSN